MLDIKLVRENPEIIKKDLNKRGDKDRLKLLDKTIEIDKEYRNLLQETEKLRAQRNEISKNIAQLKKQGKKADKELKLASQIPKKIQDIEEKQNKINKQLKHNLMHLPNILHESVPKGETEEDNKVLKKSGKPSKTKTESHVDIMEEYDLADLSRAAKISGARFWFLKGELAMLDFALQKYAIDFMHNRGYTILHPPFMMNKRAYEGVTDLKDFEDVMYKVEDEDLYLIATSEHPLTAMFMDEIFEEDALPIKSAGISSCFRKEAGAHGKDTKGIFRGHQFNKIEQIIICKPEDSWKFHEELLKNVEDFFESLNLPFRTVNICIGDMGTVAAKKYDVEVWMPAQQKYREVASCSNCTDYQARRLGMRFRNKGKNTIVHTLNSTCVATSRALVGILENNQQKDGSILIPNVLVSYMNGIRKLEKPKNF